MILRPVTMEDEEVVEALQREFVADGFDFCAGIGELPFAERVQIWQREAAGTDLPEGRVPSDFLLAEVDGQVVGRGSIRHDLNDYLLNYGGHVGYAVAPEFRGRGYAKQILRLCLERLQGLGVTRVLVTVNPANAASIGVIEACGGEFEDFREAPSGEVFLRYWFDAGESAED